MRQLSHRQERRGLTLVELLIVVTIAVVLLAASVPLLRIPLQSRKVREASRTVNVLMARAKSRAAEIGRPAGVMLKRDPNSPDGAFFASQMYLIESPNSYAGDLTYSGVDPDPRDESAAWVRLKLYRDMNGNVIRTTGVAWLLNGDTYGALAANRASGDRIRFGYREPTYEVLGSTITVLGDDINDQDGLPDLLTPNPPVPQYPLDINGDMNPDTPQIVVVEFDFGGHRPPAFVSSTPKWVPFQIDTYPVMGAGNQALAQPVDLPTGICVDLTVSGMGPRFNQFIGAGATDATAVSIMFAPNGTIDRIYHSNPSTGAIMWQYGTSTVFLLLGKTEQVFPANVLRIDEETRSNLQDEESLWVTINPQTGKVTTAENTSLRDPLAPIPSSYASPTLLLQDSLLYARTIARTATDIGGR
jgi:prepilin-type N-terminal cleavage/methylation domain-containing protein